MMNVVCDVLAPMSLLHWALKFTACQRTFLKVKRLRSFLFLSVLAALGMPWLLLFNAGVRARKQSARMDEAASYFLTHFPAQSQNSAAARFDRLAAELGFVSNGSTKLFVAAAAEQDYRRIAALLDDFLETQLSKSSGSLDALPEELSQYLAKYKSSLTALQTHLLESPAPVWALDIDRMSRADYPHPGFTNAFNVQKLLLLLAVERSASGHLEQMMQAMEASWRLNEAISQRPDLVSQLLVSSTIERQAGLLRHMDSVPAVGLEVWQERLSGALQQTPFAGRADQRSGGGRRLALNLSGDSGVLAGLQFDSWLQYRVLQRSLSSTIRFSGEGPLAALSYWFSPVYYFELTNVDTRSASQLAIETLAGLDVCQTTSLEAEQLLNSGGTAAWNDARLPVEMLVRRWKLASDRQLALELTQKILLVQQAAQLSGQWPSRLPNLDSEVCLGEYWTYEHSKDDSTLSGGEAISLSFSTSVDSQITVPLHYHRRGGIAVRN